MQFITPTAFEALFEGIGRESNLPQGVEGVAVSRFQLRVFVFFNAADDVVLLKQIFPFWVVNTWPIAGNYFDE